MTIQDIAAAPSVWRAEPHRAAVLGSPIDHSLSPVLHNAAYKALGLPWTYSSRDVNVPELEAVLNETATADVGFSVTMPLKQQALKLSDECTIRAHRAGAANTLVRRGSQWHADNTDIAGLVSAVESVRDSQQQWSRMTILGSGGTARAAALAARDLGISELTVVARRPAAAEAVAELASADGLAVRAVEWANAAGTLDADLVISTVTAGVADALSEALPTRPQVLLDVIYAPWPTALAAQWQRRGGVVIPGTRMLLHQAVYQVRLMTGLDGPIHRMRDALEAVGAPV